MKLKAILLCSFYLLIYSKTSNGDVFSAFSDLIHLIKTESEVVRTVGKYISTLEDNLKNLKRDFVEMERAHDFALKSPEAFLSNPINAYLMVKRLKIDWNLTDMLANDQSGQEMLKKLSSKKKIRWPDNEDLSGIAVALARLQDTYKLKTEDLARGNLLGIHTTFRELTANDCYELGRQSYNVGDHYHTVLWMNEALKRYEKEVVPTVRKSDILAYFSESTFKQRNVKRAFKLAQARLQETPNDSDAISQHNKYKTILNVENADQISEKDAEGEEFTYQPLKPTVFWWDNYQRLCRGEGNIPLEIKKKLTCFYKNGPSEFLLLAPVKTEVIHIHPTIHIFYEVLSDSEIENIKELSIPKFQRARVSNVRTGKDELANYRISKSSWLNPHDSPQLRTVHKRIEQVTGLSLENADLLQTGNYGVGGQYEPHLDHLSADQVSKFYGSRGNRIATLMFYLSDVELGGATVFPRIELTIWPKKGSAAFWYNLHHDGRGDDMTLHGACPVLLGQKWVCNKWIYERGQEFRLPCSLDHDSY